MHTNPHPQCMASPHTLNLPKGLIEIQGHSHPPNLRLTETVTAKRYITLRYCWRKKKVIRTTRESIGVHRGAIESIELSKTFQTHAASASMRVIRRIGRVGQARWAPSIETHTLYFQL